MIYTYMVTCPVHRHVVGTDGNGRLVGRCPSCMVEAAVAIHKIERHELAVQLHLQGSV